MMMDLETREYLKRIMENASKAVLIQSVIERFSTQMSVSEIEALQLASGLLMLETTSYLGIDSNGKLIIEENESGESGTGEEAPLSDGDNEEPEQDPPQKPGKKPGKKAEGYT